MCAPAVLFFFAFNYVPLPGIYVAFVKFNYRKGIFGSKFIGLDNFEFLLSSGKLWDLTKNTILYNLAFILLGNLLAIFVAILLNEMRCKWFKKVSQTIMFLPYFISQVLIGLLVFNLLNFDTGFVNTILANMGLEKWQPYSDPTVWPILMVIIYLWQQTGYQSVVYFAAIMGIDGEMMEAAKVDGANGFQRIRYIILPSLKPTMVILLLFALGGIVKGNFGLFYNIVGTNPILYNTTDIIETYVYLSLIHIFVMIPMDPLLIEQVLINLMENAFYHGHSDKSIELSTRKEEDEVLFFVKDYGPGISKERLETIFDGEGQNGSRESDSHRGMGIGLSICKTIITAHGGRIWAQNHENGALLCFALPIGEEQE